jgi:deoxyribonuclease V
MFLAIDVHYSHNQANAAGITFNSWQAEKPIDYFTSTITHIAEYEPGSFYKRELPCILRLIEEHTLHPESIVIDGFVFLDGHSKPGLGKYLYDTLEQKTSVIGVAKNPFRDIDEKYKVYRGNSQHPLYVTAVGIDLSLAKEHISSMHGQYRLPTLLKKVDQLSRGIAIKHT